MIHSHLDEIFTFLVPLSFRWIYHHLICLSSSSPEVSLPPAASHITQADIHSFKTKLTYLYRSHIEESVWIWYNDGAKYYFDVGERVQFRIEEEKWNDLSPTAPPHSEMATNDEKKSPYGLIVSLATNMGWDLRFSFHSADNFV